VSCLYYCPCRAHALSFPKGISWEGSVLDAGLKHELITKRGSWLSFEGERIGQGQQAATCFLEDNSEVTAALIAKIEEMAGGDG